ncbi:MAG: replication-associated recombination protein A [Verrucomicrobiia bacterium]
MVPEQTSFLEDPEPGSTARAKVPQLASRMRPLTLDRFVGQQKILGPGKLLRRIIESDRLESVIFFGPPGTGKTTLAEIISARTKCRFERLNAVESSVADLRKRLAAAREARGATLLFIDEIHRFNRAQQDLLLPDVEGGVVRLIGATTLNPYFSIIPALISRSLVFELEPLSKEDLLQLAQDALTDCEQGLGSYPVVVSQDALEHLATIADGDARRFLNALELAVVTTSPEADGRIVVSLNEAEESIQAKSVVYSPEGDEHFDTASAFIKSIRGSDPDAALYWLAKMLYAGEDPRFITRRLIISASEDIGMADPRGLQVAVACAQALEYVGLPEAELNLAHAVVYLATAPKSNRCHEALQAAKTDVREQRTLAVPFALRDAHYAGARKLGHGTGYLYPHHAPRGHVVQACLPESRCYYKPTEFGYEKTIAERLRVWRETLQETREVAPDP